VGIKKLNVDYDMRKENMEGHLQHTLAPTYAFISTPAQLGATMKSSLNPKQIH
jgi:hypothetical protein